MNNLLLLNTAVVIAIYAKHLTGWLNVVMEGLAVMFMVLFVLDICVRAINKD